MTETVIRLPADFPEIVCLCGSTRFAEVFNSERQRLTLEGKIVLSIEIVTYDRGTGPQFVDPETKHMLDELHLRKIDLADRVLVLNVGGYIGTSTRQEIEYARETGKRITWLEDRRTTTDSTATLTGDITPETWKAS